MPDDTEDTTPLSFDAPPPSAPAKDEDEAEVRHDASGRELHPWEVYPDDEDE